MKKTNNKFLPETEDVKHLSKFLTKWHEFLKENKLAINVEDSKPKEIVSMYKGEFKTMPELVEMFKSANKT